MPIMSKAEKLGEDIIEYGKVAIIAMIMVYVVYQVAQSLIGQAPATIGSIILGIGMIYIYATNQKIRSELNKWIKKK
jgi:hypothetical protein